MGIKVSTNSEDRKPIPVKIEDPSGKIATHWVLRPDHKEERAHLRATNVKAKRGGIKIAADKQMDADINLWKKVIVSVEGYEDAKTGKDLMEFPEWKNIMADQISAHCREVINYMLNPSADESEGDDEAPFTKGSAKASSPTSSSTSGSGS